MGSRQDEWHAYQLLRQRMVSALLTWEPDPEHPPLRGAVGATLAGVLVAAIALGAVAAWGAFTGPAAADDWREPGVLVVDEVTGARYVWRDEVLHPVGSYSSALLVLGDPAPRTVAVPPAALFDVPRGVPLGIPGTPDALPAPDRLDTGPWTVCSTAPADGQPRSVLVTGEEPAGVAVLGERGLLVEAPDGVHFLLWQQRRHRVRDEAVTLPALGWTGRQPVPVAPALLEALPAGPDLTRISVPNIGHLSAAVPGARVGEVFVVTGWSGALQYAVALVDGLAPLTPLQVDLLLTDPAVAAVAGQREPRALAQADFAALPRLAADAVDGAGLPPVAPALVVPDGDARAVCAIVTDAAARLSVDATVPAPMLTGGTSTRTSAGADDGDLLADLVVVAPGRGCLVSSDGEVSVVTDQGMRYPVEPDALAPLGYADVTPVALPPALVALVPSGPTLDPVAADRRDELSTGAASGLPHPLVGG